MTCHEHMGNRPLPMTLKQRCNRFITARFEHGYDIVMLRRLS